MLEHNYTEVLTRSITVLKVGRVAIITRGRYAGKKVNFHLPTTTLDGDKYLGSLDMR
jgi:hypothetical protein